MLYDIILTYSLEERSIYNPSTKSVCGWINALARRLVPHETEKHIVFFGQDDKKRIEVKVSFMLFKKLETDSTFIVHAENLRRVRSYRNSNYMSVIEKLCFPICDFDNDLDNPAVHGYYEELANKVGSVITGSATLTAQ